MHHFTTEVKEKLSYGKRLAIWLGLYVAVSAAMIVYGLMQRDAKAIEFMVCLIVIMGLAAFIYVLHSRYYITGIEGKNNEIVIKYKDRTKEVEIKGERNDFSIRYIHVSGKWSVDMLEVRYKGKRIIKQYDIGGWDKKLMKEVSDKVHGLA
jgi:hypothetical protein